MSKFRKPLTAALVGTAALALLAGPSFAAVDHGHAAKAGTGTAGQMAHMDQSQGAGQSFSPCPAGTMGSQQWEAGAEGQHMMGAQGMMRQHMRSHGMMGPNMMDSGMMGRGMTESGTMGRDMMRQGMMGSDPDKGPMMGPGFGHRVVPSTHLTIDDVRHFFEHRLEMRGNKRLKVGDVTEADGDKIVAEITTVDGSLVQRIEVDRHSGEFRHIE